MLKNISMGQSAIPLKYIIAGLEQDFAQLRPSIRLMFIDQKQMTTAFYYKAPSNTIKNLMYDVVFEFHKKDIVKVDADTEFKVYCNSPSFYFRYANAFRAKNALLFTEKYPAMVADEAKVRNPNGVSGFDKYVYSCLRMSMLDTVENLKATMYLDRVPDVDAFNKKRFEYIKAQKLAKIAKDGIAV